MSPSKWNIILNHTYNICPCGLIYTNGSDAVHSYGHNEDQGLDKRHPVGEIGSKNKK